MGLTKSKESKTKSNPIEPYIPNYRYPVDDVVTMIGDNKLMATIKLAGYPYELADDSDLYSKYNQFKNYLVTLGKDLAGQLGIWTYIDKREVIIKDMYKFNNLFIQNFCNKYMGRFNTGGRYYEQSYYITLVFNYSNSNIDDGIDKMLSIVKLSEKMCSPFGFSVLGIDDYRNESANFISWLINHQDFDIPFVEDPLSKVVTNSDFYFGHDVGFIKNRNSNEGKYFVSYLVRSFPAKIKSGATDFILSIPCELTFSQSFIYTRQLVSIKNIDDQANKLNSSNTAIDEEMTALIQVKNLVQNGEIFLGDYHGVITVFGKTRDEANDNGIAIESGFSSAGYQLLRANDELDEVFASALPDAKKRPLSSIRSTTTLAEQFSLHNVSVGKRSGNPMGDGSAMMPLETLEGGIHYLSTHESVIGKDVRGEPIAGHALFLGQTGTGKTTLQAALTSFIQRFDPMLFSIDFKQSMRLPLMMMGAEYFVLTEGQFTGLNPFQLDEIEFARDEFGVINTVVASEIKEKIRQFCYSWVERIGANVDGKLDDGDSAKIVRAVNAVMELPRETRRFSNVLELIATSPLRNRLSEWSAYGYGDRKGRYAWAVDSPKNNFDPLLMDKVAFDSTVILKKQPDGETHPATEPLLAVLFFYKDLMKLNTRKKGRWTIFSIEEFWMPANFPLTQAQINSSLKSGRLEYEMCWLISQSPNDAINCKIFTAINEQTTTRILLPNPSADFEDYKKIGLTRKEFKKLKSLTKESRTFLIKKSSASVFACMDLHGFDEFLPILSGDRYGVKEAEKIIERIGSKDPNDWVPIFISENSRNKNKERVSDEEED
ncbi:conjugal transfer protein [Pectobacterium atrosepticum ICMP 1526]|uniref:VirB4 family type IV secretion/conjugal transfer ATPase n=1 Tax=Pectobacterium atrosepticum TaxID=29471 RepID=UPI0005047A95|nr:VirB4 family type IV secretion system protein [Pectobacterium atrosepticum]KFX10701.1 conjugal transfer protein TraE [Pectobacterium atrosepticum]KMK87270.1 conjugal transfer protein [Pectobacterium atrosepticum ICMP 1526]